MKLVLKLVWHLLAIAGLVALVTGIWLLRHGIGSRQAPGPIETTAARAARSALIPAADRARRNPEPATAENLRAGLEHFADHCASCHANDGSGDTAMGRSLYPRAPDMRLPATQQLTDGELFYIIERGVKFSGMPAWGAGTPDGEQASWHLVQFIRRLPELSEIELLEMDALNPRPPDEWRALEEERRFLSGELPLPPPDTTRPHHKGDPP